MREPGAPSPWLHDYSELVDRLPGESFPDIAALNALLPAGAVSGGGAPLRFRAADELPGVDYERHVYETGEVSTRAGNWHDLYNALAWCRWPRLKAAMNARHYAHLGETRGGRRGPARDALTLLDESGALVVSAERALLAALAARDWRAAFLVHRDAWARSRCLLCGHALLEKLRAPYKAVTAHALLLRLDETDPGAASFPAWLDGRLADSLHAGGLCRAPADLSPLPLMGIPGWWSAAAPEGRAGGPQDAAFYADRQVFRPPRPAQAPAPVHELGARGDAD